MKEKLVGEQLALCKKCNRLVCTMPMMMLRGKVKSTFVKYFDFGSWTTHAEKCFKEDNKHGWSRYFNFIAVGLIDPEFLTYGGYVE